MKTKIAHLTATIYAFVMLAPAAFAAPEYGPKPSHGTKDQAAPTCETGGSCKGKDCCTTKLVSTGISGYHHQVTSTKRILECNANCPLTAKDQAKVCKSGSRA